MARLVTSGGEIQDHPTTNAGSPDGYSGGATLTATETSVVRSGSASFKCAGTAANTSFRIWPVTFASAANRWARVWVRFSVLPNATKKIAAVTAGATLHCSVRLTAAGKLQLWNDRSGAVLQIGSDSAATLAVDTWYRLELLVNVSTATAVGTVNDSVELRLGVPEDNPAAAGTSVATGTVALGNVLPTEIRCGWVDAPGVTSDLFVDDVAVNDSSGTAENSWPTPDGRIVVSTPVRRYSFNAVQSCGATDTDDDAVQALDAPPEGHADTTAHTAPFHQYRTNGTAIAGTLRAHARSFARCGVQGNWLADASVGATEYPIGNGGHASTEIGGATAITSEKRTAQFFLNGTLDYAEAYLKKIGSPTDDLVAEIVQGIPVGVGAYTTPTGGTTISSTTMPMADLNPASAWTKLQFDNIPLTLGQAYWLVLSRTGANDAANYVSWYIVGGEAGADNARTAWVAGTGWYGGSGFPPFRGVAGASHALRVVGTQPTGKVILVQYAACIGSTVATPRTGALGSGGGIYPTITNAATTFPTTVAGVYPANWKWVTSAVADAPLIRSMDRGPRIDASRTDAVAEIHLWCFAGATVEYSNPPNPG